MEHHDRGVRAGSGGLEYIGDEFRFVVFALEVDGFGKGLREAGGGE